MNRPAANDLQGYLRSRAHVGEVSFGAGLAMGLTLHLIVLGLFLLPHGRSEEPEPVKVTWVNLPAAKAQSGGADAPEVGKSGERLRQVEDVAPKVETAKPGVEAQDPFGLKAKERGLKGTNPDKESAGKAPVSAKAAKANPNSAPGTAGSGGAGGIGQGSSIPGLNPTQGVEGGMGLIGLDSGQDFPFTWYLQQVQGRIVGNWQRLGGQGRVQIYFRIKRDGSIESARVESPSGNDAMDASALLAVRRAAPLPPLPGVYGADYLGVRFWFSYVGN
ncbi:MAG TPA: TonB family protein [Holophagaceae bacterium]|nr:TonB family protein [Holophagaceae bacterium]